MLLLFLLGFPFFSHFLTFSRSCNGHAPLIIQEGCACAGQKVQPRRVGQNYKTQQFQLHGNGENFSVLNCSIFTDDSDRTRKDLCVLNCTMFTHDFLCARTTFALAKVSVALFFNFLINLFLASLPPRGRATGTPLS
jgi:hypothetical protein